MSVITPLKIANECFYTLTNIYEKKAPTQKRALKNKLHNLTMEKDEIVASFFTNISKVRNQVLNIIVSIDEDDLIQTIDDGLPSSWETFLDAINGQ